MSLHNPKLTDIIIYLWVRNRESISLEIIAETYCEKLLENQIPCPNATVCFFYSITLNCSKECELPTASHLFLRWIILHWHFLESYKRSTHTNSRYICTCGLSPPNRSHSWDRDFTPGWGSQSLLVSPESGLNLTYNHPPVLPTHLNTLITFNCVLMGKQAMPLHHYTFPHLLCSYSDSLYRSPHCSCLFLSLWSLH